MYNNSTTIIKSKYSTFDFPTIGQIKKRRNKIFKILISKADDGTRGK